MKELQKEKLKKPNHFLFKLLFLIILFIALAVLIYEFILIQPKSGLIAEHKIMEKAPSESAPVAQIPAVADCFSKLYLNDLVIVTKLKLGEYNQADLDAYIKQTGSNELRKYLYKISSLPRLTLPQMQQNFADLSLEILAMHDVDPSSQSWFKRYIAKLIRIKKIDAKAIEDGGVEGEIAEVKVALERDNLENAMEALHKFSEEQQKLLQPFITQLQNQIALEDSINQVYELIMSKKYQDNFSMVCSK